MDYTLGVRYHNNYLLPLVSIIRKHKPMYSGKMKYEVMTSKLMSYPARNIGRREAEYKAIYLIFSVTHHLYKEMSVQQT